MVGATQSSAWNHYTASKLLDGLGLDGQFSSLWESAIFHLKFFIFFILHVHYRGCAHTNGGALEWFSIELPVSQKIARVQIANRIDSSGRERGNNIRITIGPSEVYDPNEPLCLPEISSLSNEPGLQDYFCVGNLHKGKFVKISRPGYLNLCEVKVFTHQGNYWGCEHS